MSEFKSVKCDECGRIQDGANHWMKIQVWVDANNAGVVYGIALGNISGNVQATGDFTPAKAVLHDLCGQGCAMKHIAKLLGWSSVLEAGKD